MNTKENKKRRNLSPILFLLVFLLGAVILFYPRISFWLAEYNQNVAIQSYNSAVSSLTEEEKEQIWEQAKDYNRRMVESVVKDPFASTENIDPFDEYFDTLDVGEGTMGYIRIPGIEVRMPIYHGTSDEVLEKGVGHIKATALPIGGEGTHSVLTGHTGLHTAEMFDNLDRLEIGDEFYVEVLDHTLAYRVDQIEVVEPDDVSKLQAVEGEDFVTLVTCTPYGVNSHRLLVRGERCEYNPDADDDDSGKALFPWWIVTLVAGLLVLLILIGRWTKRRAERRANSV